MCGVMHVMQTLTKMYYLAKLMKNTYCYYLSHESQYTVHCHHLLSCNCRAMNFINLLYEFQLRVSMSPSLP